MKELLKELLTNSRVLCGVNVLLLTYDFYYMITYNMPSHPRYPYPVAILGAAMMCFLGWYIVERASTTKFETYVGFALLYLILIAGIMGMIGIFVER